MKRVSKAILIAFGVLVILLVAAVFGLNMYVQTPAAQAKIQEGISRAIGLPVQITSVTIGWGGLKIAGVRIPTESRPLLEANSFTAQYRMLPLIRGHIAFRKMTLESPTVVWAQNAQGQWVLPIMPAKGQKDKLPNAPGPAAKPGAKAIDVEIDTLEIRNATIEMLDAKQKRAGLATGVTMTYSLRHPEKIEGTIDAERISWGSAFNFTDVHSPLVYEQGALTLPDLRATLTGGQVQAKASVQTEAPDAPYSVSLKVENVDLARLAADSGWPPQQASGSLAGAVDLTGNFRDSKQMHGKGKLTVRDGHFVQLDLFQTIGQILQIPELADLRVRTGEADFSFGDDRTSIAGLRLETPDLEFNTSGTVKYDGKMSLNAQLAVSERIAQQLPSFVRTNFSPPNEKGRQSIAFDITGRTDNPKTNLLKRIVGQQVTHQFDDLLNSVFGGKKKEKKEDRRPPETPEAATNTVPPSAAPSTPVER